MDAGSRESVADFSNGRPSSVGKQDQYQYCTWPCKAGGLRFGLKGCGIDFSSRCFDVCCLYRLYLCALCHLSVFTQSHKVQPALLFPILYLLAVWGTFLSLFTVLFTFYSCSVLIASCFTVVRIGEGRI
ncbi:hypothetical protein RvY_14466-2 [Ramazzottius varieornatus]|uniref:Uncharacterized protein n=1 Tax=Ramazzottius varieornatus TaxID=947166 RepID=A0A1D1VV75_RAMVA|nr:hypothetical protein RvY_14466-2 [Ramazzottius varieornatus]